MAHKRTEIRSAVKTILTDAETDAGARVYASRVVAWRRGELPGIAVYTDDETVTDNQTAPRELQRTVNVIIEIGYQQANQADNVDDKLDALALQVERAMHADPTLDGKASDSVLRSTEVEMYEDGSSIIGVLKLTYSTTFFTYAPEAADVELDDLSTVDIRYSLEDAQHADDQANDLIENLEE